MLGKSLTSDERWEQWTEAETNVYCAVIALVYAVSMLYLTFFFPSTPLGMFLQGIAKRF